MTENDTLFEKLTGESSRRSFMKKSAVASGGLAMGLSGAGTAGAQGDGQGNVMRGLMFNNQFHPRARFEIISEQIDWAPVESDQQGNDFLSEQNDDLLFSNPDVFGQFNTRVINYQIGRQAWGLLFVHERANVEQGQVYELSPTFQPFGRDDFQQFGMGNADDDLFNDQGGNELGLVTVQFSPVQGGGGGGGGGQETTTTQDGGGG